MKSNRFLSLFLAACLLLTSLSGSIASATIAAPPDGVEKRYESVPELDGTQSGWSAEEIVAAWQYGLTVPAVMSRYSDSITRLDFCRLAVRLYERLTGLEASVVDNPFSDTNSADVLRAYGLGIVNGVSADRFAPDRFITRQELAVMVHRALKASFGSLEAVDASAFSFSDAAQIASWARAQMEYCHAKGIVNGIGNNRIGPLGNTTREQAIAIAYRTFCQFATAGTADPSATAGGTVPGPESEEMLGLSALEAGDAALPDEKSQEERFAYAQEIGDTSDERLVLFGATGSDLPATAPTLAGLSSSGELAALGQTSAAIAPPSATIAPTLPGAARLRPTLPAVLALPSGSVYTSAQNGVFVDVSGSTTRWFAFLLTDDSGIANVAWQVSDHPFSSGGDWRSSPRILLSGQVSASAGRFSVDFDQVVENLNALNEEAGLSPIPQQQKRFYVRAIPVNGRGGVVGDAGAGLAVLVGTASPEAGVSWSTAGSFDLWTPREATGGYRGEFLDIPAARSGISFSPEYEANGRLFHFHLPDGDWSRLIIQVSSQPFSSAMNWPESQGLISEKSVTPAEGKSEVDRIASAVPEEWSSTAVMVRFRDFCPPSQELQPDEYLKYYVRGIALMPGSAPGTLEPVYSSVVTVNYGYATPITLLQPQRPVYDYLDMALPQLEIAHYEPARWPDREALQHYVVYRAPAASEILFTWVNADTGERLYPYIFYQTMYANAGIGSAAEYEQQVIPKVLPVGATVYVPAPTAEDDPWYEELWDGITEFFEDLAAIGGALVNAVAGAYNNLKTGLVQAVAGLCPIPSLRDEFAAALEVLVDYGLATMGLPPSLPNFDQLTDMSLDYMAEVALQEAGVPADQITRAVLKDVAEGIGEQMAAAANHADPNLLDAPFLKLNPEKQYRPAYVDIRVSNPSDYPTVAGAARLETTFEFDYWSMYANPYDANDGITLTAANKYGYGSSAGITSSLDYMNHFFYGLNGQSVDFAQGETAVYDVFDAVTDAKLPSLQPGESMTMRLYLTPKTGGTESRYPGGDGAYYEDFENMYFGNGGKDFTWLHLSGQFQTPQQYMAEKQLIYIPSEPAAQLSWRPGGTSGESLQKPLTSAWDH